MKFAIATAPHRDSLHWQQKTITWEEIVRWTDDPKRSKEAGNYILGTLRPQTTVIHKGATEPCTGLHRRKDFIVSRSALTLDIDHPDPDFADRVDLLLPYMSLLHTTYSSTPEEPRYRLIIPTDREMAPDEYVAAANSIAAQLGEHQFDPGSSQPERYMFRPAARHPERFQRWVNEGDVLVVDAVLVDFVEDLRNQDAPAPHRNKRNPFDIEGTVGAFNRAYEDWDLLISTYDLPYERVDEDRFHLIGARSQAGMGPVAGTVGLVYSHHANDPAFGRTCSAFDLVRLHRFADEDESAPPSTPVNKLPSHNAMLELAARDPRVTAELVGVDFEEDMDTVVSSEGWRTRLQLAPRSGKFLDVIANWDLVTENDPMFGVFYFNEMSMSVEASADLPWRTVTDKNRVVATVDRWAALHYLERTYGIRSTRPFVDSLIDTCAMQRVVNPVRDYLDGLRWDYVERLDTCLPGVEPTAYTRLVARKAMVAAVARMFQPGCKWDHTLVLYGPEGLGKSWWIDRMARGYSSSLGRITDKDTLLVMQRSWIMVSDEGHSLRKDDADQQKEFLTRTADVFRMPYDRETLVHPRHCVIWSTTNDETFLRRQEGNRRFLIVNCEHRVDFNRLTNDYVDQVWAEAVFRYRAGEPLYLGDMESETVAFERERFVEEDVLGGLIHEYVETAVPEDWWERSPESRRQWMLDRANGFETPGTRTIDVLCSAQVWTEALGRRFGEARRGDLLDITNAIKRLGDWEQVPGRARVPGYGPQVTFRRRRPT